MSNSNSSNNRFGDTTTTTTTTSGIFASFGNFGSALSRFNRVAEEVSSTIDESLQSVASNFGQALSGFPVPVVVPQPPFPQQPSTSESLRKPASFTNHQESSSSATSESEASTPEGFPSKKQPSTGSMGNGGVCGGPKQNSVYPENDMICDNCTTKFSFFKKKRICHHCKVFFCSSCISHDCKQNGPTCLRCKVLLQQPPIRANLMELRVKDLQRYLISKKVSTKSCVEKKDLVELIIREKNGNRGPTSPEEVEPGSSNEEGDLVRSRRTGTTERKKSFPKSYVQSTHRDEWFAKQRAKEDVVVDDFVLIDSVEDAAEALEKDNEAICEEQPQGENESTNETENSNTSDIDGAAAAVVHDREESASKSNVDLPPNPGNADNSPLSSTATATVQQPMGAACLLTSPKTESVSSTPSSPRRFANQELVYLSEIESLEDLQELSVKQAKDILAINRVTYKGIVEKEELLKIVRRLWIQEQKHKEEKDKIDDEELCKICMDAPVDCVMLECGHMCTCTLCGKQMSECPICRQYVVRVVRTFKA